MLTTACQAQKALWNGTTGLSRNADMEHLLEFLERQPSWLRRLVWDAIISFLADDEGDFSEEEA